MVSEKILKWGEGNPCTGIFTQSLVNDAEQDFCVVFVNAGLIHKIGPNGIYVKLARELAEKGINSFRFDFAGIGDSTKSDGGRKAFKTRTEELTEALDALASIGVSQFILVGICSGAEDSYFTSLTDERIIGLFLIDGVYIEKDIVRNISGLAARKCQIRYYKKNLFKLSRWKKILTGKSKVVSPKAMVAVSLALFNLLRNRLGKKAPEKDISLKNKKTVDFPIINWETLINRGVKIQLLFCEGSSAIDIYNLTVAGKLTSYTHSTSTNFSTCVIKNVDHTFTPQWSQDLLKDMVARWVLDFSLSKV